MYIRMIFLVLVMNADTFTSSPKPRNNHVERRRSGLQRGKRSEGSLRRKRWRRRSGRGGEEDEEAEKARREERGGGGRGGEGRDAVLSSCHVLALCPCVAKFIWIVGCFQAFRLGKCPAHRASKPLAPSFGSQRLALQVCCHAPTVGGCVWRAQSWQATSIEE